MDSRVVTWVREFIVGHTRRVRVGGQLCKEVEVTSSVSQESILGSLLFLVYINDIWRNNYSNIRLFADDCIIYRKITNKNDTEELQKNLDTLGEWVVENGKKINPTKSKAIRPRRDWVKNPLGLTKKFRILGNNLTKQFKLGGPSKLHATKSLEDTLLCNVYPQKGNKHTRSLASMSLVYPVLEHGAVCWDPSTEGHINALDQVQTKAAQFTNHTKDSDRGTLVQHRTTARLCGIFKAYSGQQAWTAIRDRLQWPYYLSRVGHVQIIRDRKQRTRTGKYSFVNRTIKNWNQLPAEVLGKQL